jgi:hypothetical protein
MIENALLRQQLIVINRQVKRPLLTNQDRQVSLARTLHPVLETSRFGGSIRHCSSLASGPVSFLLAMEIERQTKRAKNSS